MHRTPSLASRPALVLLAIATICLLAWPSPAEESWRLDRSADGIEVYTRPVEGSGVKEFKGVSEYPAAPDTILAVLRDSDRFKTWFPNTPESKLLERTGDVSYQYSVMDAPWPVSDRDNVLRSQTTRDAATGAIRIDVVAEPDRVPEREGRVRVQRAKGQWRLEPTGEERTRVTFQMHLEPGGGVPAWLINARVVETPFEALANLRAKVAR